MHKRFIPKVFIPTMLAISLLAACQKAGKAEAGPITISYGIWDNSFKPFLDEIIASFESANPNITVDMQIVPWSQYWTKLQTAMSGGEAWDVFWINAPFFPIYQQYGIVASLAEDYQAARVDLSDFPQALVNMYQVDGEPYTLPWFFDTVVFYYNKERFQDAGVDFPNADWSLDDVLTAAQQLTLGENQWGTYVNFDSQMVWGWIYSNGGQAFIDGGMKVGYGEPPAREVLRKLYDIVVVNGFSPSPAVVKAGGGSAAVRTMLAEGGIAMVNLGSWAYSSLSEKMGDNLGVAPLPAAGTGKSRNTILHGLGHIAYAKSPHLEAAKKFAVYMTSPEAQSIIANANAVMPAYQPALAEWVKNFAQPEAAQVLSDTSQATAYPVSQTGGLDWNTRATEIIHDMLDGNIPFDEAVDQAVSEANRIIAEQ